MKQFPSSPDPFSLHAKNGHKSANFLSVFWVEDGLRIDPEKLGRNNVSLEGRTLSIGSRNDASAIRIEEAMKEKFQGRLQHLLTHRS